MKAMQYIFTVAIILLVAFMSYSNGYKLVCYYDISSANRVGPSKFTTKDMELALHFCTHIIYSHVTIMPKNYTVTVLTPERERALAGMQLLKTKHPNIKFLLSVSGENSWKTIRDILNLLGGDQYNKDSFIKSIMKVIKQYKFDGLSLNLPLPTMQPKSRNTFYGKLWHNFVNLFKIKSEKNYSETEYEYKAELTTLIQKLSANLKEREGVLSLNVLPNVDPAKFFDIDEIIKYLDFVILSAFDFYTPQRNPKEADLISPTKPDEQPNDRLPLTNIKSFYKYWHSQNVPRYKIIIGVAAYGRAWKMTKKSNSNGIPPILNTAGPAAGGPQTQIPGFLSWPEICYKLSHDPKLTRVIDSKAKSGVYAFRPADSRGNFGIWISYEDPISIAAKTVYVRNHNLGGVALFDISLDDVHGECSGEKFPLLRTIKFRLRTFLS